MSLPEARLKSSRLILILCSLLTLSVTACQPGQDKKTARKVRVSTAARAKMTAEGRAKIAAEGAAEGTATPAAPALTTTDNVLCNISAPELCEAISVSFDGDKLLGISRQAAANSGAAKTLAESDVEVSDKKLVTANIEFKSKNDGATLMIIALASDDDIKAAYEAKLKATRISTIKYKVLKTPLVATEVAAVKTEIEANKSKVLVIAPIEADLKAASAGLALTEANRKELVVDVASESRVLLEEALRYFADVIPLQYVMPHEKTAIVLSTLHVYLNGRTVGKSEYGSTAESSGTNELKIWLKDRATLNAKSKIKITYNIK